MRFVIIPVWLSCLLLFTACTPGTLLESACDCTRPADCAEPKRGGILFGCRLNCLEAADPAGCAVYKTGCPGHTTGTTIKIVTMIF